jgi:hypothetical protein
VTRDTFFLRLLAADLAVSLNTTYLESTGAGCEITLAATTEGVLASEAAKVHAAVVAELSGLEISPVIAVVLLSITAAVRVGGGLVGRGVFELLK